MYKLQYTFPIFNQFILYININNNFSNLQAPFLASVTVGSGGSNSSPSIPGWSIISPDVNKKPEDKIDNEDASTQDATTQKGFDIENFKPQLFGGFKPLYSLPDNIADSDKMRITDREEKSLFK